MNFMAVFDQSGRCKYVLNGDPGTVDVSGEPAVVYMENPVDPNTVWYDHAAGRMVARMPFSERVSSNKIEGIPAGTTVYVGPDVIAVDDGSIEFEVSYPQTVVAVLRHVRHIDKAVEVPCEVAA